MAPYAAFLQKRSSFQTALLPGIELSCQLNGESVHVLGYAFDPDSQSFIDFCKKGMIVLDASDFDPTLYFAATIHPLSVLKQIISLFLSINPINFRDANPELAEFVLNPCFMS